MVLSVRTVYEYWPPQLEICIINLLHHFNINVDEEQNQNKHFLDFISIALELWDYFTNLHGRDHLGFISFPLLLALEKSMNFNNAYIFMMLIVNLI